MKHRFFSVITILLLFTSVMLLNAQESDDTIESDKIPAFSTDKTGLDVGGVFGIPSGFIMRYWFTDRLGVEAISGFSLDYEPLIGVDMLYQPFGMFHAASWNLYFTIGAGVMLSYFNNNTDYIARFPVGLTMPLDNYPVLFTVYGAPAIVMNETSRNEIQWGLAVTYSFSRGENLYEKRQQAINRSWSLKSENEGLKSGLSDTKGQLSKTESDLEKTKGKLSGTESDLEKTKGKLSGTESDLEKTKGKLSGTESDLEKTKGKLSGTENELNSIKSELGNTKTEISKLQNTLTNTKGELETVRSSLDEVKLRLDGAKEELNQTQQKLNEKDRDLKQNQADLNKSKEIAKAALEGKDREEEEKKIAQKQLQLNREFKLLSEEKVSLKKGNEEESKARNLWKEKCTVRRGVLNSDGECVCRVGETWNAKRSACVCINGYTFNKKTDTCEPCAIVNLSGACVSRCGDDEKQVSMKEGPHQFACVKRCRGANEVWLKSSKKCACDDGYTYDSSNKCVPRR